MERPVCHSRAILPVAGIVVMGTPIVGVTRIFIRCNTPMPPPFGAFGVVLSLFPGFAPMPPMPAGGRRVSSWAVCWPTCDIRAGNRHLPADRALHHDILSMAVTFIAPICAASRRTTPASRCRCA